jgi:hypothetical protein
MCISCATPWIICHARLTTIVTGTALDLLSARYSGSPAGLGGLDRQMAGQVPEAGGPGRGNIIETLTFYRLPRAHRKHLKSTNLPERLNEKVNRRTLVVRISPNTESCLRLIQTLCVEIHETWLEDYRYLNMTFLAKQKNELLRLAA